MNRGMAESIDKVYEKIIGLNDMFFIHQYTPADICRKFEFDRYYTSREMLDILRQKNKFEKVSYHGRSRKASEDFRGEQKRTAKEVHGKEGI